MRECPLTERNLEIIKAVAVHGYYKLAATFLGMAGSSIKGALHNSPDGAPSTLEKIGAVSITNAVYICMKEGWID